SWIQVASAPLPENPEFDPKRVSNPTYQEFVTHELPKTQVPGICALLTGSCLAHHFSAVFSLHGDPDEPERVVFEVDLADRCRTPVEKLAATYIVSHPVEAFDVSRAAANSILWDARKAGRGSLALVALAPANIPEPRSCSLGTRVEILAQIDTSSHTQ